MKEIKKSQILPFLRHLGRTHDVYLPMKQEKDWVFDILDPEVESINFKPVSTILPLKKFFLPHNEIVQSYNNKESKFISRNVKKPLAIFGVSSVDIDALVILDQVMSRPHLDTYYQEKRNRSLIIGIGLQRINIVNHGFDLFLEENEDGFVAISSTAEGNELTKLNFFEKTEKTAKNILSFRDPLFNKLDKIQKALNSSYGSRIWKKLAETCFGCGICSYVCPLCYCHEYEEEFNLDCNSCKKRQNDACFLPDFFATAGHNPRENLSDRMFNWYYHKFVRMPKEYGHIGCVDCGRCIKYCPARINFKQVLKGLIKNA